MPAEGMREKWDRAYASPLEGEPEPAEVVVSHAHLLPLAGDALDLACGLGGNALFLARRGFSVSAWDISPVAIAHVLAMSGRCGLHVQAQARDVEAQPFPCGAFDVVTVSRFLSRRLAGPICDSLRPGGACYFTRPSCGIGQTQQALPTPTICWLKMKCWNCLADCGCCSTARKAGSAMCSAAGGMRRILSGRSVEKDIAYFKREMVLDGTVAWPHEQDIGPDTLYLDSVK